MELSLAIILKIKKARVKHKTMKNSLKGPKGIQTDHLQTHGNTDSANEILKAELW
jgi:hypothetical protein